MRGKIWLVILFFLPLSLQADSLKLLTARRGGTYYALGKSLEKLPGNPQIKAIPTPGSMENLMMVSMNMADLAIVQWDMLLHLKTHKSYKALSRNLLVLAVLYQEEVHILVRKSSSIRTLEDLAGKKVGVGPLGSGSHLSASQILKGQGMGLNELSLDHSAPSEALKKLYQGTLDALFYTIGKPTSFYPSDQEGFWERISLLDLGKDPSEKLAKKIPYYSACKITRKDYPSLKGDIFGLSVPCVLITHQNTPYKEASRLCEKIFNNQRQLLSFHPKWRELDITWSRHLIRQGAWPFHPGARDYFFKEILRESLKVMTGTKDGQAHSMGEDLEKALLKRGLRIQLIPSRGSLHNLISLTQGQAQMALVQRDVLLFFQKSPYQKGFGDLQCLLPLFPKTIHLLVPSNSSVRTLSDLKGKKIHCGLAGSETFITATILFSLGKMNIHYSLFLDYSPRQEALQKLLRGNLQAMILLGPLPLPELKNLSREEASKIKLVPLTPGDFSLSKKVPFPYRKAQIPSSTYPFLPKDISTLSTTCLLLCTKKISPQQGRDIIESLLNFSPPGAKDKWTEIQGPKIQEYFSTQSLPLPLHEAVYKLFSIKKERK